MKEPIPEYRIFKHTPNGVLNYIPFDKTEKQWVENYTIMYKHDTIFDNLDDALALMKEYDLLDKEDVFVKNIHIDFLTDFHKRHIRNLRLKRHLTKQ